MNDPIRYGELKSEQAAEESRVARDIVREIGNFGVSDRQRWLIMYFLALELEKNQDMDAVVAFIIAQKGNELFVSGAEEEADGKINGS